MDHMTHAMRRAYWTKIITECNQSGSKKAEWCELHNVDIKAYYRWQRKLRAEAYEVAVQREPDIDSSPSHMIVELKRPKEMEAGSPAVVVHCGSADIEIQETVSDEFLARLMKVMSNAQ